MMPPAYRAWLILSAVMCVGASFHARADPPDSFLQECQEETRRVKIALVKRLKVAPTPEKKTIRESLKRIQRGDLVAPPLRLLAGSVGRAPLNTGAAHIRTIIDSQTALIDLPIKAGTAATIERYSTNLEARLAVALSERGESQAVIIEGVSSENIIHVPINGREYRYMPLPDTLEVFGERDGTLVIRPFDLQSWARMVRRK